MHPSISSNASKIGRLIIKDLTVCLSFQKKKKKKTFHCITCVIPKDPIVTQGHLVLGQELVPINFPKPNLLRHLFVAKH